MIDGKIALEGDRSLVDQLEEKGYGWIEEEPELKAELE
jgi:Fe-S cluster assembly ATPase SufC